MNKIIIDNENYDLNSYVGKLVIKREKTQINISGNNELYIEDNGNSFTLNMLDEANANMFVFNKDKKIGTKMYIIQNNNTKLKVMDIFQSSNIIKEEIKVDIVGNNNSSNINIRVVQDDGNSEILEQITARKNTNTNIASESLKGLACGGSIVTLPNMEIDTDNIIANHYVTISSYNPKELNYLMSKGITKNDAQDLIRNGYLFSEIENIRDVF